MPAALQAAVQGDHTAIDGMISGAIKGSRATADELSAGLHAATTCAGGREAVREFLAGP